MSSATPLSQCRIKKAQGRGSPTVSSNVPSLYSGQKWDDNREVSRLGWGVQANQAQCIAQLNTHGLGFWRG